MGKIANASLEELRTMKEQGQISPPRPDAVPVELPADFWDKAEVKFPVSKQPVNLRIDADILEFFKEGGRGYQTRIHAVLRSYVDAQRRGHSTR